MEDRTRIGKVTSAVGIGCNVFLAVLKLIVGFSSGMISVIADSINNFSDSVSSIVSLIGFKMAEKPADDEHPFGHARFEYISGLVVAFLVMIAGIELLKESFSKIMHPEEISFGISMFIILGVSIFVKGIMFVLYRKIGKEISSNTLLAASQDSRNDVFATSAVLVSAVLFKLLSFNIDGYVGAAVAIFVLISGVGLIKDTIDPLLGIKPDENLVRRLSDRILSYEGVLGIHDLMIHDYGPNHRICSVHVEVPAESGFIECHNLVDLIERELSEEFEMSVLIHYDPIITDSENMDPILSHIKEAAEEISSDISIHDFRMIPGEDSSLVLFDCVVPEALSVSETEVLHMLTESVKQVYPKVRLQVHFDQGLVFRNKNV